MNAKAIFAVAIAVVSAVAIYRASDWWERAYATYDSSETSPDRCIRVDTYKAFWVLPSVFHRTPHPGRTGGLELGRVWDEAIFKRAYEVSTGAFLGETAVFDPVVSFDLTLWNEARKPGRRVVLANGFPLVDSERCADEATLAKLEAFYERKREGNRELKEALEEERKRANPRFDSDQ